MSSSFLVLDESRLSYWPIGLYLLDVTIVYHTFLQIAIAKMYELNKNILYKREKVGDFFGKPLQSVGICGIIKR